MNQSLSYQHDEIRICAIRSGCIETLNEAVEFHEWMNGDRSLPFDLFKESMTMKWLEGCKYLLKKGVDTSRLKDYCVMYSFADFELLELMNLQPESLEISRLIRFASRNPDVRILRWVMSVRDFNASNIDARSFFRASAFAFLNHRTAPKPTE